MGNLTDFSVVRNWKQAIVFCIAYTLLGALVGGVIGGFVALFPASGVSTYQDGVKIGATIAPFYILILGLLVLKGKNLYKKFGPIVLFLIAVLSSMFAGAFGGSLILAIMTTLKNDAVAPKDTAETHPA